MINTIDELANRRQYFRIEDTAYVEISLLKEGENAAEHFDLGPEFGLVSEFQHLDLESKPLLRTITDKDRNLGQYLNVLNKKIDAISRVLALSKQNLDKRHIQDINLSEGGIALKHDAPLPEGARIAIKLVLLPAYSGLVLAGKVLSSRNHASPYELHIEFEEIAEQYQQLIARHIMRKQSAERHK